MKMKKIYISPEIEIVECVPGSIMITASSLETDDDKQYGEGDGFDGEAADEYRGSWEGIWDNM